MTIQGTNFFIIDWISCLVVTTELSLNEANKQVIFVSVFITRDDLHAVKR